MTRRFRVMGLFSCVDASSRLYRSNLREVICKTSSSSAMRLRALVNCFLAMASMEHAP